MGKSSQISEMINYYDLFHSLIHNKDNIETFEDLIEIATTVKRQFRISDIEEGIGMIVESLIRFWNDIDRTNNTPIEEREPIKIYIDSPGGSLTDAFTIVDAIRMSETPVWIINIGCAYSSGLLILIAGHKRFGYPHSSYMAHEGSAGMAGDAGKLQNFSSFYKIQLGQLKDIILDRTNVSPELYDEKRRDDWWLTAEEAKELGFIDEIIDHFI